MIFWNKLGKQGAEPGRGKYLVHLIILALALIAHGSAGADGKLQQKLNNFHSMQADFKQVATTQDGQTMTSKGKMWLQKPNHFRWQVTSPNRALYVANGTTLWTYEPDLQQATQKPLTMKISQTPILLLSGKVSQLDQLFAVSKRQDGSYRLTPKAKQSFIKSIQIAFTHGAPSSLTINNRAGQTTKIAFSEVKLNQQISAKRFNFQPPSGVSVLK